jgi:P-type Ca2+ transporter type 2C
MWERPLTRTISSMTIVEAPQSSHAADASAVADALATDLSFGLTEAEAADRRRRFGPNRLHPPARPRYARIAARQLLDPLVALLLAAAAVSALIGESVEAVAIAAIVVLNGVLGFLQEAAAERAVLALRESFPERAAVVREGHERELHAEEIVPGDLIVLREGDRVPADARIVESASLELDESALTGESLPVAKGGDPVLESAVLADRSSVVFAGTSVTRGHARGIVVAAGARTELGQISLLADEAKPPITPLQARLGRLSLAMVGVGLVLVVGLGGAMLARGESLEEAFLVGVSVAVAAVPEGLAATVTIALAIGSRQMAGRGAIVRRLPAIETLGEITLACTDKTGTLTENRLRVAAVLPASGRATQDVLAVAALASAAELLDDAEGIRVVGDPVDGAVLLAALEAGLSRPALEEGRRLVGEIPFSSERRRMTVVYEEHGQRRALSKGAPEVLLERSSAPQDELERLERAASAWSGEGFRVLAVAERGAVGEDLSEDATEVALEPVGLLALHDPLRAGAADAVSRARSAGVTVWMLTGDHPATARTIGDVLGLGEHEVYARVTPADKLAIVERAQGEQEVVLVTGDGVNDAPALRRADVGVAMGLSGTEPAREAADVVLVDDDFATIVAAIREGRRIDDNIRKFVAFLLSANLGEVVLFAVAVIAGLGVPMAVVQVLLINVLTDGLPALALSRDPAAPDVMRRLPRRRGEFVTHRTAAALVGVGVLVGLAGLAAYLIGREMAGDTAQTMAFATVALAELGFVFSCRSANEAPWRLPTNRYLFAAVGASVAALGAVVYLPLLHDPFGTSPLGLVEAGTVIGLAVFPAAATEVAKLMARRRQDGRKAT